MGGGEAFANVHDRALNLVAGAESHNNFSLSCFNVVARGLREGRPRLNNARPGPCEGAEVVVYQSTKVLRRSVYERSVNRTLRETYALATQRCIRPRPTRSLGAQVVSEDATERRNLVVVQFERAFHKLGAD
jgi:hypothetical protein